MEWITVQSSNVSLVAHEAGNMYVMFKGDGAVYKYADVPAESFNAVLEAQSVGSHLNQEIQPKHESRLLGKIFEHATQGETRVSKVASHVSPQLSKVINALRSAHVTVSGAGAHATDVDELLADQMNELDKEILKVYQRALLSAASEMVAKDIQNG